MMTADVPTPTRREHPARGWYADTVQQDAAARAQLRRCHSGVEAASLRVTMQLARRMGAHRSAEDRTFGIACELARVLAWVRADEGDRLIRTLGWTKFPGERPEDADRPRLSEVRFRRLLRVTEPGELADQLIRLIRLADGRCPVGPLAEDFEQWCTPSRSEAARQRWAFDYFNAAFAAPSHSASEDPSE